MIGVYTANFGGYDILHEPLAYNPRVAYRYFTDRPIESTHWNICVVPKSASPHRDSRYYFINSCLAMPDCDITLMHGANAELAIDPGEIVDTYLLPGVDIAAFAHPHRQTVYQEAEACIRMGKDTAANINPQIERYRAEGFPEDYSLSTCIFLIRRNTETLQEFENLWWSEVKGGSHRDQLSFDYCRWKLNMGIAYIPGDPYATDLFKVYPFH